MTTFNCKKCDTKWRGDSFADVAQRIRKHYKSKHGGIKRKSKKTSSKSKSKKEVVLATINGYEIIKRRR